MMTCDDASELLSALIDEALSPGERARLDVHLGACPACRAEIARLRQTIETLRGIPAVRAPAGFVDRVVDAAAAAGPWRRRALRTLLRPLPVKLPIHAAVAAMLVVGVIALFRAGPEIDEAARPAGAPRLASEAPAREPDVERSPAAPLRMRAPAEQRARRDAAPAEPAAPAAPETFVAKERREVADAPALPAVEASRAAERERTAPPASRPERLAPAAAADIAGELAARTDLDQALVDLAAAITGAGGREVARRAEAGAVIVDLVVPRQAYPALARELERLGRWAPGPEPPALPDRLHVRVRVTG